MGERAAATGPDFSQGVSLTEIPRGGMLAGRVGDEPVLLSRLAGELFAVGGACTHYGAPLAAGLVEGATVRCPLHHACFSLRTGGALRAPAFDSLERWRVEVEGPLVFVREKEAEAGPLARTAAPAPGDVRAIVIVGGGAAGFACADELRRLGFAGSVTLISAEADPPCDRPNLSKDYLAGTAPEAWIRLRPDDWYRDRAVELRRDTRVVRLDPRRRTLHLADGEDVTFDRLLLATGSEARRLEAAGFDRANVFTLRSFADARAVIASAGRGARAAVIGSSFIGLEAAASLRTRGVEVAVVSLEKVPFAGVFGDEVGTWFRKLHEAHGVKFHLGTAASSFDGETLRLVSGETIAADFVLVGIGVRPRTELAEAAELSVEDGVWVDGFLESSSPGIYCAGDIAAFPDPLTGERIRIEHWVTAQRQGQTAAANMLGAGTLFEAVPFFWTEQYGVALRYAGHAPLWDEIRIDGDIAAGDFRARYYERGELCASASVGRDLDNLKDERRLEARVEALAAAPPKGPGTIAAA